MQKYQQWETAGEAAWGVALQRETVIRPLAEQPRLSAESIAEAACLLGLSRSALYELLQRYRRRPQASSLLPWKRGRKPNRSLLGDEREALLKTCIDEFYLRRERPSLAALQLEMLRRFAERALAIPNYRTVRRRVEAVDAHTALRRRDGAKGRTREARTAERFVPTAGVPHGVGPDRPHHGGCHCRGSREPAAYGRPWLTLAVDVKTRMVAGCGRHPRSPFVWLSHTRFCPSPESRETGV